MIDTLLYILTIIGLLIACILAVAVLVLAVFVFVALVGKIISIIKDDKYKGGR